MTSKIVPINDDDNDDNEVEINLNVNLRTEFYEFANLAAPSIIIQLFLFFQWIATLQTVGKYISVEAMNGASLASLIANLTGYCVIVGILTAQETLGPQYFGSKNYKQVTLVFYRSFFVVSLVLPFIGFAWWNTEFILVNILGEPLKASEFTGIFLRIHLISLLPIAFMETVRRFYSTQNIVKPFIYIAIIALFIHLFCLWLFIIHLEIGFVGAAASQSITNYSMVIMTLAWTIKYHPYDKHVKLVDDFFSIYDVFEWKYVSEYLALAIPGVFSMSEWVYWEVILIFCGKLGEEALATHSIAYAIIPLAFMVPLGLQIGLTTRIGQLLARNEVKLARELAKYSIFLAFGLSILVSLSFFLFRTLIINSFTNDKTIVNDALDIWYLVCFFIIGDYVQGTQSGLLRALGFQFRTSLVVFSALFIIGLPLCYYLMFVESLGVKAAWISMNLSYILLNFLFFVLHYCANWQKLADAIIQGEHVDS